jgi:hypothetical protein
VETSSQVRSRGSPASSRCLSQCSCLSPLSPPTAGLVFFTGEISPKREIKNQKKLENENVFEVFFKSPEIKESNKNKNRIAKYVFFAFPSF